jgi:hypothetical protein
MSGIEVESSTRTRVVCCNCDKDCAAHHWMCDEPGQDGAWCPTCWEGTACCAGVHGEGCPTQVIEGPRPKAVQP